eukprot:TRINITY_DN5345_c0_g2_i1.p1 TRINITY_DN5345_c0_g2~~TRINITY_DN5345_c0_g2_i1.p1  ORF type:complete len:349 (+),score=79.01 TRINITY_DN5345_c0_g2_i1:24-1070(+)
MVLRAPGRGLRSRSPPRRPTSPPRRPTTPPRKLAAAPTKSKAAPAGPPAAPASAASAAASASASKIVGHFPLTNKEAEALLGLEGGYFLELARSSNAKLALIPKAETGTFEIQACGFQEDIKATKLLLSQVLNDILSEAGVPSDEAAAEPAPSERVIAEDSGEVEANIHIPEKLIGLVLCGRRPGEKGMGKLAGIADLQDVTGAVLTSAMEKESGKGEGHLVLNARGTPANVEAVELILKERMDEWKDIVEEYIEAPSHVKALIMKNTLKIEAGTDTMIGLKSQDGVSWFRITGLPAKVSVAKAELQGFVETTPSKVKTQSQGKGKEKKGDGKGKQNSERASRPRQKT